ncbi:Pkinase-domain-containing protein [Piedraia hortae CBS 480.64]|uniref:mitogen-activated protein kinase n=1 Tax=Piedraia hortae CBS 480.64 TaxID=1314780 RepID=A0A6A7BUE4_9PEZI|nr:Pkinase-domain-containing protein [Piedraia hortae CBS 480.64]
MPRAFTSPTESEFSDGMRDVADWDELRVSEWLRSIHCGQYVDLFRKHNINGANLLDLDAVVLKDMGIRKIGDRVRIGAQAKRFRSAHVKRASRRSANRQSLAALDANVQLTPPSSASPRPLHAATRPAARPDKRMSRRFDAETPRAWGSPAMPRSLMSSPAMPRSLMSSPEATRPATGNADVSRSLLASPERKGATVASRPGGRPQADNLNASIVGALPSDRPLLRVIFENGRSSVVNVMGFRTAEDIVRAILRKGGLNEKHFRSYCLWVLDGTDANPASCRRLSDAELVKLCNDGSRSERGRLILRKLHTAEPEGEQLRMAARIAEQQTPEPPAIEVQPTKARPRGVADPLPPVTYPMSPASQAERREYFDAEPAARTVSQASAASARARKLKDFYGARPPTELISQDLESYFPEVAKEEIDRTVRMSIRRSQRLSKAVSQLSTMSNFSVASSLRDAPPIPSIAEHWASQAGARPAGLRPISVVRLGRPESYRESVAGSVLEPLDEESPLEPNRQSYVSFSDSDVQAEPNAAMGSYFDDSQSSPGNTVGLSDAGSGSFNSRLSQFIAQDGEEEDEELMQHLEKDSWDDLKYMKGAMIGQGSFGTVSLALHAVTGELMAVKQVEMPSKNGEALDAKKNHMVEALKQEISLLRELKHENIVRYLGSNSEENHLNIFLEYVAGGSVATMLVNYGSLGETLIANFVRQILQGLAYLHSKDIIHRDIKGANILVDNKGTVKISDFGISKRVEATTMRPPGAFGAKRGAVNNRVSLQGSVFWMAPEVVRQTAYTKKADIWSLGCLIVEMFTGSHPHPNCTQLQAIFKIGNSMVGGNGENARPEIPAKASQEAKEFLRRTFELEHEKRPTAEELAGFKFCQIKS